MSDTTTTTTTATTAAPSKKERLEARLLLIENAMDAILTGGQQSASIDGVSYSMLNIDALQKLYDAVEKRLRRETRGTVSHARFHL